MKRTTPKHRDAILPLCKGELEGVVKALPRAAGI